MKHTIEFNFTNNNAGRTAVAATAGTVVGIALGKAIVAGVNLAVKAAFPPKSRWARIKQAW